ncbi:hypothetical protein scyTo_0011980 [Scyliorhinus torazame]|uniref:Uncharacterized protein n=1 Tax=Scyliorhinus torazame TaxID=75743 RepID=A0A401NZI0_SCYTO|nr:hypothetical protein [Scyliorhinus torazame]
MLSSEYMRGDHSSKNLRQEDRSRNTEIFQPGRLCRYFHINIVRFYSLQLISSDADGAIQRAGRFRVENGSSDENIDYTPGTWHRTDVHLENPEYHTRWYFKYFLGKGNAATGGGAF